MQGLVRMEYRRKMGRLWIWSSRHNKSGEMSLEARKARRKRQALIDMERERYSQPGVNHVR